MLTRKILLQKDKLMKPFSTILFFKNSIRLITTFALIGSLFFSSCKKIIDNVHPFNQYLVYSEKIGDFTKQQLDERFNPKTGRSYLIPYDQYDISVYKIVYKTKYVNDSTVFASGAVILPKNAPTPSLLSMEHGDILNVDALAPSHYAKTNTPANSAYYEGSAAASSGYITILPDYLGYGISNDLIHPPSHRESLATSCTDMIFAAKEFLRFLHQPSTNKLYLAGYSEGGFANLSLQKYIQNHHLPLNVMAASSGGAPSHISKIAQYIFNYPSDPGSVKNYLAVILFYNAYYPHLSRPLSAYLQEPYATEIQKKGLENVTINASLNTILNPTFVAGINSGTDVAFINALKDNDVYDWKPIAPLQLYHGTNDIVIPFFNSQDAYTAMTARGGNVQFIPLPGLGHDEAIEPFVEGTLAFFKANP
ncbi:MAG: lipase family protein [Ilyomonas sp.]